MTWSFEFRDVLAYIYETLIFLFFACFSCLPRRYIPIARWLPAFAAICILHVIYAHPPAQPSVFLTFFIPLLRLICYIVFLFCCRDVTLSRAFYLGLLCVAMITACQGIMRTPIMYSLSSGLLTFTEIQSLDIFLSITITHIVFFLIFSLALKLMPLREINYTDPQQVITMAIVFLCGRYVKYSLEVIMLRNEASSFVSLSAFFFYSLLLSFIVLSERLQYTTNKLFMTEIKRSEYEYRYNNRTRLQFQEEDVSRLRHDMKNHMLAIQALAKEQDFNGISRYTQQLIIASDSNKKPFYSGNKMLDCILWEKYASAKKNGITMHVDLDFRQGSFISDFDICVIFGNLIDNALEACLRAEGEWQFIDISGKCQAGHLLVTVTNTSTNQVVFYRGLPITTKSEPRFHGIGLSNVTNTLKKYGGQILLNAKKAGIFSVNLDIPVPAQTEALPTS